MKQVVQDLKKGGTYVLDVPAPQLPGEGVLVRTRTTLISAGTERMLVEFGKAGFIGKARRQPEKVREVFNKIQTDGLFATYDAVSRKLTAPLALGYSNVGVVEKSSVGTFRPGDRVVSNGCHAGFVAVGKNLCAKIPDEVSDAEASFAILGAVALQGIRLADPTLGETFAVFGVGVIGLLTVQLLRANGCRVIALDFDHEKLKMAEAFGAETVDLSRAVDPCAPTMIFTNGVGIDGAIITASTPSNKPISQAANMCRKRGRIVLVGVTGMTLNRSEFYEKELTLQVSCSYGPGRYDSSYEKKGLDYPIGHVRWTEQRNISAVLQLLREKKIDVAPLVTHRFDVEDVSDAYAALSDKRGVLGILLDYSEQQSATNTIVYQSPENSSKTLYENAPIVAMIGAGAYAQHYLAPAIKKHAFLHTVASLQGLSAAVVAKSAGFKRSTTHFAEIHANPEINTLIIASPHNTHAEHVVSGLRADKNVFVEKPLCLTLTELESIQEALRVSKGQLMVGFNRRFAPFINVLKKALGDKPTPASFVYTINAGAIPVKHWSQDPSIGGGRIIGEACHFIDLVRYLAGCSIQSFQTETLAEDTSTITLKFESGSVATIHYFSNGSKSYPKERLEVFSAGRVAVLDNFRKLFFFGWNGQRNRSSWFVDKGQKACVQAFLHSIRFNKPPVIPAHEIFEVSCFTLLAADEIRKKARIS